MRIRAPQYIILGGALYRKDLTAPVAQMHRWRVREKGPKRSPCWVGWSPRGSTGTHKQSTMHGALLVGYTSGCHRINSVVRGMPNLLADASSTSNQVDEYSQSAVFLSMGNRHRRSLPTSTRESEVPSRGG